MDAQTADYLLTKLNARVLEWYALARQAQADGDTEEATACYTRGMEARECYCEVEAWLPRTDH